MKVEWTPQEEYDDHFMSYTYTAPVPGGWLVTHIREWQDMVRDPDPQVPTKFIPMRLMTTTFVADPLAPHVLANEDTIIFGP